MNSSYLDICFSLKPKLKNVVINSDLTSQLEKFIIEETDKLHDENAKAAVDKVISGEKNLDDLVDQWTKAYTQVSISMVIRYVAGWLRHQACDSGAEGLSPVWLHVVNKVISGEKILIEQWPKAYSQISIIIVIKVELSHRVLCPS